MFIFVGFEVDDDGWELDDFVGEVVDLDFAVLAVLVEWGTRVRRDAGGFWRPYLLSATFSWKRESLRGSRKGGRFKRSQDVRRYFFCQVGDIRSYSR